MNEIISMIPNRELKLSELSKINSSASEIDNIVTNGATQADLDALVLSTGNLTESQVITIDSLGNSADIIDLLIPYGNMKTRAEWSNGTIVEDGLNIIGTSIILKSVNNISLTKDNNLAVMFHAYNNGTSRKELNLSFYNVVYGYPNYSFYLEVGENKISFVLPKNSSFVGGDYKLYLNAPSAVDVTIKSILVANIDDVSIDYLAELYTYYGFQPRYMGLKVSKNAIDKANLMDFVALKEKSDYFFNSKIISLEAYALSTDAIDNPTGGVFAGSVANINAIQRAINSVPIDTNDVYEIKCIGNFTATTFAEMSTVYGDYRSMVSLTRPFINLIGVGNQETVISAELPSTGSTTNYSKFQTLQLDTTNTIINNIKILGKNLRYPIHTEAGGTGINIDDSTILIKNTYIEHLGNNDTALTDWTSFYAYGVGLGKRMSLTLENCILKSKGFPPFGGHDQYQKEDSVVNIVGCNFSYSDHNFPYKVISFNMFGKKNSKCHFNLVGNNFNYGSVYFGNSAQDGFGLYVSVSGHGNSKFIFEQKNSTGYIPNITDTKITLKNRTASTILKYTPLSENYNVASGEIYAIARADATIGDIFDATIKGLIPLSSFSIKSGESILDGDYIKALNGELINSISYSNTKCKNIRGTLYLDIG